MTADARVVGELGQILGIGDEGQFARPCLFDAGDAQDFDVAVALEVALESPRDLAEFQGRPGCVFRPYVCGWSCARTRQAACEERPAFVGGSIARVSSRGWHGDPIEESRESLEVQARGDGGHVRRSRLARHIDEQAEFGQRRIGLEGPGHTNQSLA